MSNSSDSGEVTEDSVGGGGVYDCEWWRWMVTVSNDDWTITTSDDCEQWLWAMTVSDDYYEWWL
jgi:hypothetical protein